MASAASVGFTDCVEVISANFIVFPALLNSSRQVLRERARERARERDRERDSASLALTDQVPRQSAGGGSLLWERAPGMALADGVVGMEHWAGVGLSDWG